MAGFWRQKKKTKEAKSYKYFIAFQANDNPKFQNTMITAAKLLDDITDIRLVERLVADELEKDFPQRPLITFVCINLLNP